MLPPLSKNTILAALASAWVVASLVVSCGEGGGGNKPNPSKGGAANGHAVPRAGEFQPNAPQEEVFAQYAGSESCRACHAEVFAKWEPSNHGQAERSVSAERDGEAFEPAREFVAGREPTEAKREGDQFELAVKFDPESAAAVAESLPVERAIGNDPLIQYLVPTERGRLQASAAAFDPHQKEWFCVFGDEPRERGEWGHWMGRGMNWNAMCAACHNTRLRKNYEPATDSYQTAMAERSVGCESCHGPMKAHADWQAQYPGRKGDPSVKKQTPDQILDTCAGCHSRRSELTGDFCPTDNFFDHYAPAVVDETDLYYADGQVRDEVYVYSSFRSSRMFHAGVRCLDCHDPHSNKPILPGNQLCMRCHTAGGYPNSPPIDPAAHTFHLPESAGSQCVNCHMPHTTYMGRHPRRDHGFTIPDPLLTKELGIPNACNRCHQDQDADWALAAVEKWYGDRMERRTRERARWIADAREGKPSAKPNMVKMLEGVEGDAAYWRASAAALLERWVHEPDVVEVLARFLGDADPLVRAQAALSLAPAVEAGRAPEAAAKLRALLDDPIRMVRVNAAWALRESVSLSSAAAKDLRRYLDHNTDQPTGALQLGVFLLARNQVPEAIAFIGKAVEWDPLSAPLRHEYAVALSMMGRIPEAVTQLEKAVELAPEEAEFQFKLSLAYNEMRNLPKVIEALRKTVEIDPNHSRAWYNLGLALNQIGDPEGAINALAKAESTNPEDPGPPYAAATIHFRLGNIGEARAAAQRAVTIAPDFEEARQLLFQLSVE